MARPPEKPHLQAPLWGDLTFSAKEEPLLEEQKRFFISRGAAIALATLGPVFFVLNLVAGNHGLAIINLATSLVAIFCLFLNHRGKFFAAALVICAVPPPLFITSALLYHNGMEYILLLNMMTTIFMFNAPRIRLPLVVMSATGFLVVSVLVFNPSEESLSVGRFATNLVVFLGAYYWILELIRSININYQEEIVAKNDHLQALTSELERANMAKEKIFRIVAHDLRGPLGNLQSTVNLVSDGDLSPQLFRELLPHLRAEVENASHCLDTLLQWSSSQLSHIQPVMSNVSLKAIWVDSEALLADSFERKGITLRASIPEGAEVQTDSDLLTIVVRNLLSNALKFTPEHGVVTLKAEPDSADTITDTRPGFLRLSITDTGLGMSPERITEIFSPLLPGSTRGTENERGLGLGLRICLDLLQVLGSTLAVSSEERVGSTFYFSLPVAALCVNRPHAKEVTA